MKLKLKKGLDLRLEGAVADAQARSVKAVEAAVTPDDFPGLLPKLNVKEGDPVKIGTILIYDKKYPELSLVSPVAGRVKAVVRGERRKIIRVVVESDGTDSAEVFDLSQPLHKVIAKAGLMAMIRRRPYDVVPDPAVRPRDIFVTALDTAPLALPLTAMLPADAPAMLAAAVKGMAEMTDGKVYLCHGADWTLGSVPGAEMVEVEGPHPAGNVGVQIANIDPLCKGENVWGLDVVTLYRIGKLFATGKLDCSTLVAVCGPEVAKPSVVRTVVGAAVAPVVDGLLKKENHHVRVISGNVLTGTAVKPDEGFLHFPYRQVTVIAEGDDVAEFMGWASISPSKLSVSRALPLHWLRKAFSPDARLLGGRRAMIMSGEYDRVLPMDVMAEYLIKAALSRNIDDMERLGIYEVAPEDVALCEFVDTSKLPVQKIIRDGLDYLRKELE